MKREAQIIDDCVNEHLRQLPEGVTRWYEIDTRDDGILAVRVEVSSEEDEKSYLLFDYHPKENIIDEVSIHLLPIHKGFSRGISSPLYRLVEASAHALDCNLIRVPVDNPRISRILYRLGYDTEIILDNKYYLEKHLRSSEEAIIEMHRV